MSFYYKNSEFHGEFDDLYQKFLEDGYISRFWERRTHSKTGAKERPEDTLFDYTYH
ncbi:MAG: hypothetical protein ACE5RF_09330 [Nitrosarchaeum sp.]